MNSFCTVFAAPRCRLLVCFCRAATWFFLVAPRRLHRRRS
ncbi:hypothetical protein D187_002895 [Cystobacter fuscus DSM 2262]|uniref:Uncharacterized protein n=1 Tax=Cystobacter fuscus (strain ATCC 25194 / DSM 2262 / NBRC 100088 / M29) TaxID=1242864 RepID=S9P4K0_CYSF2|nr:hypothetical protein D187_002895 [Cystobacter fuscus DSM 2262]